MERVTRGILLCALAAGSMAVPGAVQAQKEAPEERQEQVESEEIVVAPPPIRWRSPGGQLGVAIEDLDRTTAEELGLSDVRGVRVTSVSDGSPAAEAGIREGDAIVRFDGRAVRSARQLVRLVRETPPGREVEVRLVRDSRRRTLTVEVGDRRSSFGALDEERMDAVHRRVERSMDRHDEVMERLERLRERFDDAGFDFEFHGAVSGFGGDGRLGLRLQPLTDQLRGYFEVEDGGALVASVRPGSPASEAGIRAGDVVVRVGDRDVDDPGDAAHAVGEADAGPVSVTVVRDGRKQTVTVELPAADEEEKETGEVGTAEPVPPVPSPVPSRPPAPPRSPRDAS